MDWAKLVGQLEDGSAAKFAVIKTALADKKALFVRLDIPLMGSRSPMSNCSPLSLS
jgi:hypothetical protein